MLQVIRDIIFNKDKLIYVHRKHTTNENKNKN
jgi:hypothetical protein